MSGGSEPQAWRRSFPLRVGDIDGLGHLTAIAYMEFFEENRSALVMQGSSGAYPTYAVVKQSIEYLGEVTMADREVTIELVVHDIRRSSLDLAETLLTERGTAALSKATLVMWDVEARGSRPIEPAERALFQAHLEPAA